MNQEHLTTHLNPSQAAEPAAIPNLIARLGSADPRDRRRAGNDLIAAGPLAVSALTEALEDRSPAVRSEAARALGRIRDAAVAAALVKRLEDESREVRWTAAEGLVALGKDGLIALLRAMMQERESVRRREAAHHVLRALADGDLGGIVRPVLAAIEGLEPALTVPLAAHAALHQLEA
ncbi:MAG: HEAT repeat domain-containing protein [Anaerolineae bacterium]|nr:HEAT repeat domain-containing protein [Anaerolineae bacterium]